MSDVINPQHYKHLPVEAIDIIMAAISKAPSNEAACLHWQVLKYLLRCWEKKGIEDLRKAKWYLDRLVGSFDDLLAEINAPILQGANNNPTASLNSDKIPEGYRKLGDSSIEPRRLGDLRWSVSKRRYVAIVLDHLPYANQHNWAACRRIEERSEPPPDLSQMGVQVISELEPSKRYREPTLADLANGPIECEYRDDDDEQWRSGFLVYMLEGHMPFLCVSKDRGLSGQWIQCQIEVQE